MVNLTIRNIPDEILKRIRIFAARERRSLNSELLIVIEDGIVCARLGRRYDVGRCPGKIVEGIVR